MVELPESQVVDPSRVYELEFYNQEVQCYAVPEEHALLDELDALGELDVDLLYAFRDSSHLASSGGH